MKKLSMKDKVIYTVLVVGGLGFGLGKYYIIPTYHEYTALRESVAQLEYETEPMEQRSVYLTELKTKADNQKGTINTYRESDSQFVLNSQNLLAYIGPVAEKNKVSITLFRELDSEENEDYTKMPYHLVLQGDYINLLNVVDSLEGLDYNYTISEYSMKVIDVHPDTNKPIEKTATKSQYKWTSGSNTYVTGEFPLFRVDEVEEETVEETTETGEVKKKKLDYDPIKRVQIEFKLNFLLLESGEGQTETKDPSTEGFGKDNPFYHQIMELAKKKKDEDEVGDDYLGDDLQNLSDAKKAVLISKKEKLQEEIDKTLVAIYNREQKKMPTDTLMNYLQSLLSLTEEGKNNTEQPSESSNVNNPSTQENNNPTSNVNTTTEENREEN